MDHMSTPRLGLVPLDPDFVGDPYRAYQHLRDHDPVHRIESPELLRRFPHVGVDVDHGVRTRSAFTRGWVSLPITGL